MACYLSVKKMLKKIRKMKTLYRYIGFAVMLICSMHMMNAQGFQSSMTKIDFIDGSGTLKFTTKLNTHHISEALKINANTAGFEAEVKKYMNTNFNVAINGSPKTLTFTGSQVSGETVWVYFETSGVSSISSLRIKNSILVHHFPKQLNLVNIAYKGQQKTMNFMKGKEIEEIKF